MNATYFIYILLITINIAKITSISETGFVPNLDDTEFKLSERDILSSITTNSYLPEPFTNLQSKSQCSLFKYKIFSVPEIKTRIYNSSFYFYFVNDLTFIKNVKDNVYYQSYYRYIEIFNKTRTSFECTKIESHCILFEFKRNVPFLQSCFKVDNSLYHLKRFENLKDLQKDIQTSLFENYMEKLNNNQCEYVFNSSFSCETSLLYKSQNFSHMTVILSNLKEDIRDNYQFWNYFALNTFLLALGLFMNTICFFVFLSASSRQPKIMSSNYFAILSIIQNVFLLTHWFIFSIKPFTFVIESIFYRTKFFEIFFCQILTSINYISRFVCEFIILHVSIIRVLHIYLPYWIIRIKSYYPFAVHMFFIIYMFPILVIPIFKSIKHYNTTITYDINEKYSYSEYCLLFNQLSNIIDLDIGFEYWYQISLGCLIVIVLSLSSVLVGLKFLKIKSSNGVADSENDRYCNLCLKWSQNIESEIRLETISLSNENEPKSMINERKHIKERLKYRMSSLMELAKKYSIDRTILVLGISTIVSSLFNEFLLLFCYHLMKRIDSKRYPGFIHENYISINIVFRELKNILLVTRFSLMGVSFFVFSRKFRVHLKFFFVKFLKI